MFILLWFASGVAAGVTSLWVSYLIDRNGNAFIREEVTVREAGQMLGIVFGCGMLGPAVVAIMIFVAGAVLFEAYGDYPIWTRKPGE